MVMILRHLLRPFCCEVWDMSSPFFFTSTHFVYHDIFGNFCPFIVASVLLVIVAIAMNAI